MKTNTATLRAHTTPDETVTPMRNATSRGLSFDREPRPQTTSLRRLPWTAELSKIVFAFNPLTVAIHYDNCDPRRQLISSYVWQLPSEHQISLQEARAIALRVLGKVEDELHQDRLAESRFFWSVWDDTLDP